MGITTVDNIIVNWFNGGFGGALPEAYFWVGNLIFGLLCLCLAIFLSGAIGFEREYHGHAAGLRTHILVSLGSAIIMMISIYGFATPTAAGSTRDPARLAAQVISGIGFLGAGTIIQTGTSVKGLTTATTLWFVMAIGLAAGSGNLVLAIGATVISLIILVSLRKIEKYASRKSPILTLVVPSNSPILKDLIQIGSRFGIVVRDIDSQIVRVEGNDAIRINVHCNRVSKASMTAFIDEIRASIKPLELRVSTDS